MPPKGAGFESHLTHILCSTRLFFLARSFLAAKVPVEMSGCGPYTVLHQCPCLSFLIWQCPGRPAERHITRPDGAESAHPHETPASTVAPLPITTLLHLPPLDWGEPILAVEADIPAEAVCGKPFALTLRAQNRTPYALPIKLSTQEANGFIFSGKRLSPTPRRSMACGCHELYPMSSTT
jgi:hypothetical protein